MIPELHRIHLPSGDMTINGKSMFPSIIRYFIENSAHEIHMLPFFLEMGERGRFNIDSNPFITTKEKLSELPSTLQKRIVIVDKHMYELNKVIRFFDPIFDAIGEADDENAKFNLLLLAGDFYRIYISTKHKSTASISGPLELMNLGINHIIQCVEGFEEAEARMIEIKGLLNLYDETRIKSISMFQDVGISFSKRINEILNDSEIMENSKNRHLLGIPSKCKNAFVHLKNFKSKVVERPEYSNILKRGEQIINVGFRASQIPISIPKLGVNFSDFIPPLFDITVGGEGILNIDTNKKDDIKRLVTENALKIYDRR